MGKLLLILGVLGVISYLVIVPQLFSNQLMTFNYIGMLNMTRYVGLFNLWWYGSILLTIIGLIIVAKDFIKKWITINNIR